MHSRAFISELVWKSNYWITWTVCWWHLKMVASLRPWFWRYILSKQHYKKLVNNMMETGNGWMISLLISVTRMGKLNHIEKHEINPGFATVPKSQRTSLARYTIVVQDCHVLSAAWACDLFDLSGRHQQSKSCQSKLQDKSHSVQVCSPPSTVHLVTLAFIFIIYNSILLLARSYKTVTEHVE